MLRTAPITHSWTSESQLLELLACCLQHGSSYEIERPNFPQALLLKYIGNI